MEHSVIPDAQRHEAKGASTALANTVLKAVGDGSTTFANVNYTEISGRPTFSGYQQIIMSSSTAATQQPSATNTPLQIEFGVGATTTNATLSSAGLLTFNVAGDYEITTFIRCGRTTGTGQAIIFQRLLINGAQSLNSNSFMLDNAATIIPFASTIKITATAGMTFAMQIYRDSAGINNGGLISQSPSLSGWNTSPTATILVSKFVGSSV